MKSWNLSLYVKLLITGWTEKWYCTHWRVKNDTEKQSGCYRDCDTRDELAKIGDIAKYPDHKTDIYCKYVKYIYLYTRFGMDDLT